MTEPKEPGEVQAAIERLESQRAILGDEAVDLAVAALLSQNAAEAPVSDRTRRTDRTPRDARAEGERKLVTVMFADVSGFTELAAGLDPEEVRNLMNRCFDRLVPVIQRYEGTVDKFVGDAIVALFGAPVSHEDDPQRALRTATEMLAELERFNAANQTDLGLHFGINTGTVVAGSVGAEERQDYSVMGDAVNMAARLEDLSSRGEVLVGHDTARLAGPHFAFDPLPEVAVKGKARPIRAYRLRGARAGDPEAAVAQSALVGRTAELERIQAAVAALREGTGGRIAIVAEAGLGKSRLVAEARRSNGAGVRWAEGRGLSHAGGSSNGVARELIRSLLELRGEATPSETERALTESIESLAPAEVDELRPYLTHLLELSLDDARVSEKVRHLGGDVLRKRVVSATRDFIRRLARREPLVLVWEDLHWADASSIELLEGVMDLPDEAPLLILLVFRLEPGRALDLHRQLEERHGERYEVVPLVPLSEAESGALMAGVLQVGELPGALQRFVLGKAEGNPFYVQEILRELVDAGTVTRAGEKVVVRDDLQSVRIPDTLQGVLGARIDRLEAADKRALQAASVIGRIFPLRVLASLLNGARPPRLEDSIDELCRRAFLRPSTPESANGSDGSEYIFQHVITQEVAYRTILRSQRRELHRRVAELMERLYPDRSEELASVIGFHHQRAGEHAKAAARLLQAADRARSRYANEEAIELYGAARSSLDEIAVGDPGDHARREAMASRLEEGRGEVLARIGRNAEAREAFGAAMDRLAEGDDVSRSRLLRRAANVWMAERQFPKALESSLEAERALGSEPPGGSEPWRLERIELGLDRMWVYYWLDDWRRIFELLEEVRPSVIAHGTPLQRVRLHHGIGHALMRRERYRATPEMRKNAAQTLESAEALGDPAMIAHGLFISGFVAFFERDLGVAEGYLQSGLKLARKIGEVTSESRCLTYLTAVCRMAGRVERTEELAGRSLSLAREYGMIEYTGAAEAQLAWVAWKGEDIEATLARGRRAVEIWAGHPSPAPYPFEWFARWPLLAAGLAQGEAPLALEQARAMLGASQQPPPDEVRSPLRRALAGEPGDRAPLEEAVRIAGSLGYL